jgi:hypothetical protein
LITTAGGFQTAGISPSRTRVVGYYCHIDGLAWLYEHPKSGRWFPGGQLAKIIQTSTGTADRKEAEKRVATI